MSKLIYYLAVILVIGLPTYVIVHLAIIDWKNILMVFGLVFIMLLFAVCIGIVSGGHPDKD